MSGTNPQNSPVWVILLKTVTHQRLDEHAEFTPLEDEKCRVEQPKWARYGDELTPGGDFSELPPVSFPKVMWGCATIAADGR